jgi:hypothetical protein
MPSVLIAPEETGKGRTDKLLAEWGCAYSNVEYATHRLLPITPVANPSDLYPIWGKESFRVHDLSADARSDVTEIGHGWSSDRYTSNGHAAKTFIGDDEDYDATIFDRRTEATEDVMEALLLEREVATAKFLLDANNYADTNVITAGQDIGASDTKLLSWLNEYKWKVAKVIGRKPNVMGVAADVWQALAEHDNLLGRLGSQERGTLTVEMVKALLELDDLVVIESLYDSAEAGQDPDLDFIWTPGSGVLLYVPPASTDRFNRPTTKMRQPAYGKMPMWSKVAGGVEGVRVRRWRDEGKGSGGGEWVQGATWYGHCVQNREAGILFTNLLGTGA